jgi:hypothetical protein
MIKKSLYAWKLVITSLEASRQQASSQQIRDNGLRQAKSFINLRLNILMPKKQKATKIVVVKRMQAPSKELNLMMERLVILCVNLMTTQSTVKWLIMEF